MTAPAPVFTVIMATWGRGRHILPSIASILQQDFSDFELLVVGDACTDETETIVAAITDARVRWMNEAVRCRSQAGPNNAGIAAARGKYIAYLGHDDLWEPNHLADIARVFDLTEAPDFAVSGLVAHMPNGLKGTSVRGLFTDDSAKHRQFFPPSSFAHRRDVTDRIGGWNMPQDTRAPVDLDLLRRAAAADLRFASTGVVTVHKFTSAIRYLSYVQQSSDEQVAMLADLAAPGHADRIAAIVAAARKAGTFMPEVDKDFDAMKPGQAAQEMGKRRGTLLPKLQPLGAGAVIRQKPEDCAMDWREKPVLGIRFQSKNPCPRFLLPYSAVAPVALEFRAVHPDRKALAAPLELWCNGAPVTVRTTGLRRSLWGWSAQYRADVDLKPGLPSVLEFRLDRQQRKKTRRFLSRIGFGIGKLRLKPLS